MMTHFECDFEEFFLPPRRTSASAAAPMRIVCFSTHSYDRESLQRFNAEGLFAHDIVFLESKLNEQTVRPLPLRADAHRS